MKTLPHNDEAEKAILGALLMREDAYDIVSEVIDSRDFYQPMNGVIYTAITKMKETSNRAIDFITLIDFLKKEGSLDKAGGVAYIASLTEAVNVLSAHYYNTAPEKAVDFTVIRRDTLFTEENQELLFRMSQ